MKIEVTRSFSKKIQLRQYEPIEFFCSVKAETEEPDFNGDFAVSKMLSGSLDKFVQSEVEKSANKFKVIDHQKSKDVGRDDFEQDLLQEVNK